MLLVDVKNVIFFFIFFLLFSANHLRYDNVPLLIENFDKFRETVNNLEQRQVEKHHAKRKGPFLLALLFNTYKI